MKNLLKDTLAALTYYDKRQEDIDGVIFFNEDLNKLQQMSWSDFERFAYAIDYDINDGSVTGRRMFKSRFFIVSDCWYLARSTNKDNYEGWVYYDHALEVDQDNIEYTRPTDDTTAFLIADLPAYPSDYVTDEDYDKMFSMPTWTAVSDGAQYHIVVHGVDGRVYWSDYDENPKIPQLLVHPKVVAMVRQRKHKDTDIFNNKSLSLLFAVDDSGYIHQDKGDLVVTQIPAGHFTVYMNDDGNEVVQSTIPAPYYD